MESEKLFSLFAMPPLFDFLQKYASDVLINFENLRALSPAQAEFIEKGWESDLRMFYSNVITPLYNKLKDISPWRLHQESQLLEEVETDLRKNLTVLIDTWREEIVQNAK